MSIVRRNSVVLACLLLTACKSNRSPDDAGTAPDAVVSLPDAAPDASAKTSTGVPSSVVGEWERATEPYKGMRIAIHDGISLDAVVTAAPPVTQERLAQQARYAPATARAQLECQRSLWKPGDRLITSARAVGSAFEATILVRDWGFTGVCRHSDSHAPARLTVAPDGELTIDVTRGKTVTQRWTRVPPHAPD